ncbi:MAG TPA: hypothetical protein VMI31_10420, partial [Fimbriimonadaceae bacterium]|nr:hypothetical protein [Fimbriimonadaceae bacterium]
GELNRLSPDAPFLALGQTVFWDEPMKAGLLIASNRLGYSRRFIAGVHDTDYFAKLASGRRQPGKFAALPHNDTTTQGLWSAAGEFSCLFGSETVVTRAELHRGGLKMGKLMSSRPDLLDRATEAWGWRGIVSLDENPPITAELPLRQVYPTLQATCDWAFDSSLECLAGEGGKTARALADRFRTSVCEVIEKLDETKPNPTLADFYQALIPDLYAFVSNGDAKPETAATTALLRFNRATAGLPRFEFVDLFAAEKTRRAACDCYDEAVHGGGQYELRRFGTGAIPFDLVVPGKGRGTLRVTRKAVIVMTPTPLFITLKKPLESIRDLAEAIERKQGPDCVLVGKAVSLIGMLSREFVFVFHEGASSYVKFSRKLHQSLQARLGVELRLNPIFRLRYDAWSALQVCCSWIKLPEPLQGPFGADEVCAPSIAGRWKGVAQTQEELIDKLGHLKRPVELLAFLETELGGSWKHLAEEYQALHDRLEAETRGLIERRARRVSLYARRRELRTKRVELEVASGRHFRAEIFERSPTQEALAERARIQGELAKVVVASREIKTEIRSLMHQQRGIAANAEVLRMHERRRCIELEAELARMRLIRQAVIASQGMRRATHRPSAWWFRLVCPDGLWFRETVDSAKCYLEPLV